MERDAPAAMPGIDVYLALFSVQVMFASLSVVAKIALAELPGFALVAARALVATAILLAACAMRRIPRVAVRDLPTLFVYALFGIICNQLLFIAGLERSTATNAVVLGATIPVFTAGIALALGRERATGAKIVGLGVAFAGALAIVGFGRLLGGESHLFGNFLIVCNSLSFSIYLVISRGLLARYPALTVTTWTFVFGTLGILPFGGPTLIAHAGSLHSSTWIAIAYIALFPTVGTYFLNAYALARAPSSLVAIYIYLQPIFGVLLARRWLHESIPTATWIGGVLIAIGIWLVSRSSAFPRRSAARLP